MVEESTGFERSGYTERIKSVIEEGLAQGLHPSQIKGEGKLVIMEHFSDELDQAREWVKFLGILLMYAQAKDERDRAKAKSGLFGRKPETELGKALRELKLEVNRAKREVASLELDARMAESRAALYQRRTKE